MAKPSASERYPSGSRFTTPSGARPSQSCAAMLAVQARTNASSAALASALASRIQRFAQALYRPRRIDPGVARELRCQVEHELRLALREQLGADRHAGGG